MSTNPDLLKRAIARTSVRKVLEKFGRAADVPSRDGMKFCSILRPDHTPSCSITEDRYHDWSRDRHLDSFNLYQELSGQDAKSAYVSFVTPAGLAHELNGTAQIEHRAPFNWQACVDAVSNKHIEQFAKWRGYGISFCASLQERGIIGLFGDHWAFPIKDPTGAIVAAHVRNGESWFVAPKGARLAPLIIGDTGNAETVLGGESRFDVLAVFEKLGGFEQPISGIATRGAGNAKILGKVNIAATARIILLPQHDDAGEKWAKDAASALGRPCEQLITPPEFKDVNDWTRAGATVEQLREAIQPVPLARPASDPANKTGAEDPESINPWCEHLAKSMCTSDQLQKLELAPREPILGDWFKEGDLGFIFAPRGVGKTFLAIDLAHGIAEGRDVGPWKHHGSKPVLYLDGEMPPDAIKSRDRGLGNQTDKLAYINHEILFQRTGRVFNLADLKLQGAILESCLDGGIKVLFLDNLSTLVSGADENKGLDWEILQPWLLQLRRHKIAVVWIHHAGRNPKEMRGHSKREDSAFWVIRLERFEDGSPRVGARFIVRFTKCRNTAEEPVAHEWCYSPEGDKTQVTYREMSPLDVLRQCVRDGLNRATDIATEMGISKGYVSKLAKKAEQTGWLTIQNGTYKIAEAVNPDDRE